MSKKDDIPRPILWPPYFSKPREKMLAFLENGVVWMEDGSYHSVPTMSTLLDIMTQYNTLLFVSELSPDCPFFDEMIEMMTAYTTKYGRITGMKLTLAGRGRPTRWIVPCASWGYEQPSLLMLSDLRLLFNHTQRGVQNTPSAAGYDLMISSFVGHHEHAWIAKRHRRPPQPVIDIINKERLGARNELISKELFPRVYELDQKNAYAYHCRRLPTGRCYPVFDDQEEATYGLYRIAIDQEQALGCFPIQEPDGSISYPTQPGLYLAYLWREEADLARACTGMAVEFVEGHSWEDWTEDLKPWIDHMSLLRDTAPTKRTEEHIKRAIVGALGRLGMPDTLSVLVTGDQRGEYDTPLVTRDGVPYDLYIHTQPSSRPVSMTHWWSYVMMKCRVSLYQKMLYFHQKGQLVAANTDAVFVTEQADVSGYQPKSYPFSATGDWRVSTHHDFMADVRRHQWSAEKIVTPGVPLRRRVDPRIHTRTG